MIYYIYTIFIYDELYNFMIYYYMFDILLMYVFIRKFHIRSHIFYNNV